MKIDIAIHGASPMGPKFYNEQPLSVIEANIIGAFNVLQLRPEIFCPLSSGSVYGLLKNEGVVDEKELGYINSTDYKSSYGGSKRLLETTAVSYAKQYDKVVKIPRILGTYGPGAPLGVGSGWSDFLKDAINGKDIVINSNGLAMRQLSYLSDTVRGIFYVLLLGENSQAYNLADPKGFISIKDMARIISKSVKPSVGVNVIDNTINDKGAVNKANQKSDNKITKLGWRPLVTMNKGFKRTVESFLNNDNNIIEQDIIDVTYDEILLENWKSLNGKTILVTGASGMIGSYIVYVLSKLTNLGIDINIIAMGRSKNKLQEKFHNLSNVKYVIQDVVETIDLTK
jgi:nucleoside-diphosphate-sugar epimerase